MSLYEVRREYSQRGLLEADAGTDPIALFRTWFDAVIAAQVPDPNAMALATVDSHGRPSARTVLLKSFDDDGFVFFSNYDSRKAHDLSRNPNAALLFFWVQFERQVRIEGTVMRLTDAESDAYFRTRPRGSQIGAWTSPQSRVLADRAELESLFARTLERFGDKPIPLPPFWGGFRLHPRCIEFWQGRPNRLHDRILFTRSASSDSAAAWRRERLAP